MIINFKIRDIIISSKIKLQEAQIFKKINLNQIFPELKNDISFLNHEIDLEYKKDFLSINGNGKILIQKKEDLISYKIEKNKDKLNLKIF